jgi:hypothetical protein
VAQISPISPHRATARCHVPTTFPHTVILGNLLIFFDLISRSRTAIRSPHPSGTAGAPVAEASVGLSQ